MSTGMLANDAGIERDRPLAFISTEILVQLEERGLVKNLGEAVGHLFASADEVRLDRAVELSLAEWSACSIAAELSMRNTVSPPFSLVPMASRRWPRRLRRK
eukprot:5642196-Pleurochrysis_carterae.AAC.2